MAWKMTAHKNIYCAICVSLFASSAGIYIPTLYESSGLNQSSAMQWNQRMFWAVAATMIVVSLCGLASKSWRPIVISKRNKNRRQFHLRNLFIAVTGIAVLLAIMDASQRLDSASPVRFLLLLVSLGLVVGLFAYQIGHHSHQSRTKVVAITDGDSSRRAVWSGVAFACAGVFDWFLGMSGNWLLFVWGIILVSLLWRSSVVIRIRMACFLSAVYLPYLWLFTYGWDSSRRFLFLPVFPVAPGFVPAAFVTRPENYYLLLAALVVVAESLIGMWAAQRGRRAAGWLTGFACSANLLGAFFMHALLRA